MNGLQIQPLDMQIHGTGFCVGTFGELLQGVLPQSGQYFLVTLPIKCYAYATFLADTKRTDVDVRPSHKIKSLHLARHILAYYRLPPGGTLLLHSELQEGKGMASSSADLVATARAIENCFHIEIPLILLQSFMRDIEPSDGVMYTEVAVFLHREVQLLQLLGTLPPMTVVAIDEGGVVDTLEFNQKVCNFSVEEMEEYAFLLQRLVSAVKVHDLHTIGQVATRSAYMNQKYHFKASLEHMVRICHEVGGPGVVVAHSGTYIGLMLSQQDPDYFRQLAQATEALQRLGQQVYYYTLGEESLSIQHHHRSILDTHA
jgi:uncharacterized protein involved in propanediol utilization